MFFFLCSFYVLTITLFSYSCLSIWISNLNILKISSAMLFFVLFICYVVAYFGLCSFGQNLINAQAKARKSLNKVMCAHQRKWSQDTVDLAYYTMTRYAEDLSISPYSFFSINHSVYASSLALIFTYLIVLLQFKTSEWPYSHCGFNYNKWNQEKLSNKCFSSCKGDHRVVSMFHLRTVSAVLCTYSILSTIN